MPGYVRSLLIVIKNFWLIRIIFLVSSIGSGCLKDKKSNSKPNTSFENNFEEEVFTGKHGESTRRSGPDLIHNINGKLQIQNKLNIKFIN